MINNVTFLAFFKNFILEVGQCQILVKVYSPDFNSVYISINFFFALLMNYVSVCIVEFQLKTNLACENTFTKIVQDIQFTILNFLGLNL